MCSPAGFPATATVTGIGGVTGTLGAVVTGRTGATVGAAGTASGAGTADQRKLLQGPDAGLAFGPCFAVLMTPEQLQELINALELKEHDFLIEAVLVARVKDMDSGAVGISISATDDTDWITQLGVLHAALLVTRRNLERTVD